MSALADVLVAALRALPEVEALYPGLRGSLAGIAGTVPVEVSERPDAVAVVVRLAAARGSTALAAAAAARAVVEGVLAVERPLALVDVRVRVVTAHPLPRE